jgi:5-methylcytosine-specific restriction endonuclease McrA
MRSQPFEDDPAAPRGLHSIPDDELLRRLSDLLHRSRRLESELVVHIGEVDGRRLYAREGSPSMFAYCTEILGLSEHEAYLRITVARAAREHPPLLAMLADGSMHLTGIAKLAPHLTPANRTTLLERAAHKPKREIEELVAEVAPRDDVPALTRKLPERRLPELGPDRVPAAAAGASPRPALVQPLAPSRYKVQFTASAGFHDKLQRLKALMRSAVPDGDLAAILEDAVTEKLQRLEARRFGGTRTARKAVPRKGSSARSRYIPTAVRRTVHQRDGGQCCYVNEHGRRCSGRERLEFHHLEPHARGGRASADNIRLMCRTHNALLAELDFGKETIARYRRKQAPAGAAAVRPGPAAKAG